MSKSITVALVGNPNTGRTTLFNQLTGAKSATGNYPRVTVGISSKTIEYKGWSITVVDLPGTYSLSCQSEEEIQSREYIFTQQPDFLINVLDMGNLERNLLLTTQLIEMGIPRIIALNMQDEASKKGIQIDVSAFAEILCSPVVNIEARKGTGIDHLLDTMVKFAESGCVNKATKINYDHHLENAITRTTQAYAELHPDEFNDAQSRWLSIKLLEGDESRFIRQMRS